MACLAGGPATVAAPEVASSSPGLCARTVPDILVLPLVALLALATASPCGCWLIWLLIGCRLSMTSLVIAMINESLSPKMSSYLNKKHTTFNFFKKNKILNNAYFHIMDIVISSIILTMEKINFNHINLIEIYKTDSRFVFIFCFDLQRHFAGTLLHSSSDRVGCSEARQARG